MCFILSCLSFSHFRCFFKYIYELFFFFSCFVRLYTCCNVRKSVGSVSFLSSPFYLTSFSIWLDFISLIFRSKYMSYVRLRVNCNMKVAWWRPQKHFIWMHMNPARAFSALSFLFWDLCTLHFHIKCKHKCTLGIHEPSSEVECKHLWVWVLLCL